MHIDTQDKALPSVGWLPGAVGSGETLTCLVGGGMVGIGGEREKDERAAHWNCSWASRWHSRLGALEAEIFIEIRNSLFCAFLSQMGDVCFLICFILS